MNWSQAYFMQAENDLAIFDFLSHQVFCHRLHYLQMATEKLAKSFLYTSPPSKLSHLALVRFLNLSKGRPDIRREMGYGGKKNYYAYVSYINSRLSVARRIERLAPVGASHRVLNPEYPWEDSSGAVQCPCIYPFAEFSEDELKNVLDLIRSLFRVGRLLMPGLQ